MVTLIAAERQTCSQLVTSGPGEALEEKKKKRTHTENTEFLQPNMFIHRQL